MGERPEDNLEWRKAGKKRNLRNTIPRRLSSFFSEEKQDGARHYSPAMRHDADYRTPPPQFQRNRFAALLTPFHGEDRADLLEEDTEDDEEHGQTPKERRDRSPRKSLKPQDDQNLPPYRNTPGTQVGQNVYPYPYPAAPAAPPSAQSSQPSQPSTHPSIHPHPSSHPPIHPSTTSSFMESLATIEATDQPMSQKFFKTFMMTICGMMASNAADMKGEIQGLGGFFTNYAKETDTRISRLESRIEEMSIAHNELVDAQRELMKENDWMKMKMADGEDRNRRNNLRIRGVPETVQQDDLRKYTVDLMKTTLPDLTERDLIIDRIHRLPKPRQIPQHLPRDVICRIHFFTVKERLLGVTKRGQKLPDPYQGLTLFQDFSKMTLEARRDFYQITGSLRKKGIEYSWGFNPPKLIIRDSGETHIIKTVEEGMNFLYRCNIPLFIPRDPKRDRPFRPQIPPKPTLKPQQTPMDTALPVTPDKDNSKEASAGNQNG